jgi:hypothetical protein
LKKWYVIYLASLSIVVLIEHPKFDKYYTPSAMLPTPTTSKAAEPIGTQVGGIGVNSGVSGVDVRYGGSYLLEAVRSFRQEAKATDNP